MNIGDLHPCRGWLRNVLAVMSGGVIGGVVRECITLLIKSGAFPWAVAVTNVLGAFGLALCVAAYSSSQGRAWLRLAVITGFFGAMTTFSTFVTDAMSLFAVHPFQALILIVLTIAVGFGVFWSTQTVLRVIAESRTAKQDAPRPTL